MSEATLRSSTHRTGGLLSFLNGENYCLHTMYYERAAFSFNLAGTLTGDFSFRRALQILESHGGWTGGYWSSLVSEKGKTRIPSGCPRSRRFYRRHIWESLHCFGNGVTSGKPSSSSFSTARCMYVNSVPVTACHGTGTACVGQIKHSLPPLYAICRP